MIGTFVSDGEFVDYTPGSAVAAGDVVVQAGLVGIATRPIAANTPGALAVGGIFDLPKATGTSSGIAVGTVVYWDATNKVVTATASGNTQLGKMAKTAADGDAVARVLLTP